MKKLASLLLGVVLITIQLFTSAEVSAQAGLVTGISNTNKMWNGTGNYDSLVNASDVTHSKYVSTCFPKISIQATAQKAATGGGTATAVGILESSNDGTNYKPHFSNIAAADISKDTVLIVTNLTTVQTKIVDVDLRDKVRKYFRINWHSGGGTQKVYLQSSIWPCQ